MANVTANQLIGNPIYDKELHKVGKLSHLYIDEATHRPTWATVKTGFFGNKESFVPLTLAELREDDGEIVVMTDKDVIMNAPNLEPDSELTPKEQAELYRYYYAAEGHPRGPTQGDQMQESEQQQHADPERRSETERNADDSMTRYEEEMQVGKKSEEIGRVRLKKYVVTENTTVTIPLSHEEVRIEREPAMDEYRNDAVSGPDMFDDQQESVLHQEMPTAQKENPTGQKTIGGMRQSRFNVE